MTILSAIQNVSASISIASPEAVFSSTEREHFELQVLANQCASYIAKDHEWQILKSLATLTGDGVLTAFSFPADYDRMLKKAELWSNQNARPLGHITDTDRWLELEIRQFGFVSGLWSIFGDQINIKPAPVSGELVKFYYMSNSWARPETGMDKVAFTLDADSFRLPEHLLELCIIWMWKAKKKLPYAQEKDDYEDAKEKLIVADKGSRLLRIGQVRNARGVQIAYPMSIVP
jgi:hypothetical protein